MVTKAVNPLVVPVSDETDPNADPVGSESWSWLEWLSGQTRAMLAEVSGRDAGVGVVVYGRISDDRGQDAKGVARQVGDAVKRIVAEPGWRLLVAPLVDNDVSATKGAATPRPEFDRLMELVGRGLVGVVVVYMTGRLWRNRRQRAEGIELFARHGVRVLATKGQDLDMSTSSGRLVAGVLGEMDTYEVEQMSDRIRSEKEQRAELGLSPGGRAYGYGPGRTVLDAEAAVIRAAAARVEAGDSLYKIVAALNAGGVPAAKGGRWDAKTLGSVLTSPTVAGLRVHRGTVVGPAAWEGILDADTHAAMVSLLTGKSSRPAGWSNRGVHLLSGVALCGKCGARVYGKAASGRLARSYVCLPRDRGGCRGLHRKADPVDALVEQAVVGLLSAPGVVADLVAQGAPDAAERAEVAAGIAAARSRLAAIAEEFADTGDDDEVARVQFRAATGKVRQRLAGLRARQDAMARHSVFDGLGVADLDAHWPTLTLARRRAVIAELVEVTILPAGATGRGFDPDLVKIVRREGAELPAVGG